MNIYVITTKIFGGYSLLAARVEVKAFVSKRGAFCLARECGTLWIWHGSGRQLIDRLDTAPSMLTVKSRSGVTEASWTVTKLTLLGSPLEALAGCAEDDS